VELHGVPRPLRQYADGSCKPATVLCHEYPGRVKTRFAVRLHPVLLRFLREGSLSAPREALPCARDEPQAAAGAALVPSGLYTPCRSPFSSRYARVDELLARGHTVRSRAGDARRVSRHDDGLDGLLLPSIGNATTFGVPSSDSRRWRSAGSQTSCRCRESMRCALWMVLIPATSIYPDSAPEGEGSDEFIRGHSPAPLFHRDLHQEVVP
jgi:hypothetical protein